MAIELPLKPKYKTPFAKKVGTSSANSGGTGGKKGKATNGLAALARAEAQKDARRVTEENKRVLVLLPSGKRRFMKASDLRG